MTIKEKLTLLKQEFTNLKTKISTKLTQKDTTIEKVKTEKQAVAHQLEAKMKENSEDEQVLTQLVKDFTELNKSLE